MECYTATIWITSPLSVERQPILFLHNSIPYSFQFHSLVWVLPAFWRHTERSSPLCIVANTNSCWWLLFLVCKYPSLNEVSRPNIMNSIQLCLNASGQDWPWSALKLSNIYHSFLWCHFFNHLVYWWVIYMQYNYNIQSYDFWWMCTTV